MSSENILKIIDSLPPDLKIAKELVYDKCGLALANLSMNAESKEYGACAFNLNGKYVQHRVSKITPTKTGQFVTLWKRNKEGVTAPYDTSDDIDFIIITSRSGDQLGQFIFPKSLLLEKGILSKNDKGGKRGIRVYPTWDKTTSTQAEKTQRWQTKYFFKIGDKEPTQLFSLFRMN